MMSLKYSIIETVKRILGFTGPGKCKGKVLMDQLKI